MSFASLRRYDRLWEGPRAEKRRVGGGLRLRHAAPPLNGQDLPNVSRARTVSGRVRWLHVPGSCPGRGAILLRTKCTWRAIHTVSVACPWLTGQTSSAALEDMLPYIQLNVQLASFVRGCASSAAEKTTTRSPLIPGPHSSPESRRRITAQPLPCARALRTRSSSGLPFRPLPARTRHSQMI